MIDPRALALLAFVGALIGAAPLCAGERDIAALQLAQTTYPPSAQGRPAMPGEPPGMTGEPPGGQTAPPAPPGGAAPTVVPRAPTVAPTPVPSAPSVSPTPLPTAPGAPR